MHEGHTEIIVINYNSAAAADANRISMDINFIVRYNFPSIFVTVWINATIKFLIVDS